jgi:hypothetical protein
MKAANKKKVSKKDRKRLILKLWNDWLEHNRQRFNYQPVACKIDKGSLTLQFGGIHPALTAVLNLSKKGIDGIGVYADNAKGE